MQTDSEQIAVTTERRPRPHRTRSSTQPAHRGTADRSRRHGAGDVLALQRVAGNVAVAELIRAAQPATALVQRKLEVGGVDVTTIDGDTLAEPLAALGELGYDPDGIASELSDWTQDGEPRVYADWTAAVAAARAAYEKPIGSEQAALAYIAGVLGEDAAALKALDIAVLENLRYSSRSDIDQQLPEYASEIAGARQKDKDMPAQGSGRSGSGQWATSKVRSSALSIVGGAQGSSKALFPGGKYTIHHKISRNTLTSLWGKIDAAGAQAAPVTTFLASVGQDVGTPSQYKALLNMPANLEVGPPADQRVGDPGTGFDPNLESGTQTPRSEALAGAEHEMSKSTIDWDELGRLLRKAQQAHDLAAKGTGTLSAPRAAQWKPKGAKFERN
jgi:hypothetical protein